MFWQYLEHSPLGVEEPLGVIRIRPLAILPYVTHPDTGARADGIPM
jgi:hypothetical protein